MKVINVKDFCRSIKDSGLDEFFTVSSIVQSKFGNEDNIAQYSNDEIATKQFSKVSGYNKIDIYDKQFSFYENKDKLLVVKGDDIINVYTKSFSNDENVHPNKPEWKGKSIEELYLYYKDKADSGDEDAAIQLMELEDTYGRSIRSFSEVNKDSPAFNAGKNYAIQNPNRETEELRLQAEAQGYKDEEVTNFIFGYNSVDKAKQLEEAQNGTGIEVSSKIIPADNVKLQSKKIRSFSKEKYMNVRIFNKNTKQFSVVEPNTSEFTNKDWAIIWYCLKNCSDVPFDEDDVETIANVISDNGKNSKDFYKEIKQYSNTSKFMNIRSFSKVTKQFSVSKSDWEKVAKEFANIIGGKPDEPRERAAMKGPNDSNPDKWYKGNIIDNKGNIIGSISIQTDKSGRFNDHKNGFSGSYSPNQKIRDAYKEAEDRTKQNSKQFSKTAKMNDKTVKIYSIDELKPGKNYWSYVDTPTYCVLVKVDKNLKDGDKVKVLRATKTCWDELDDDYCEVHYDDVFVDEEVGPGVSDYVYDHCTELAPASNPEEYIKQKSKQCSKNLAY